LQAHCQSRTSQRYNQSFVKELAKPTHNRLTNWTKEEHRTDNTGLAKVAVQYSAATFVVNHPPKADSASRFVVKIATFAKPETVSGHSNGRPSHQQTDKDK
jgi:hypothetical protein